MTTDTLSNDELGSYIDILAESVTFDAETKRHLSKEDYGTDKTEAVAVKINNRYYIAKRQ